VSLEEGEDYRFRRLGELFNSAQDENFYRFAILLRELFNRRFYRWLASLTPFSLGPLTQINTPAAEFDSWAIGYFNDLVCGFFIPRDELFALLNAEDLRANLPELYRRLQDAPFHVDFFTPILGAADPRLERDVLTSRREFLLPVRYHRMYDQRRRPAGTTQPTTGGLDLTVPAFNLKTTESLRGAQVTKQSQSGIATPRGSSVRNDEGQNYDYLTFDITAMDGVTPDEVKQRLATENQ
jgi:hypothetical protein